MGWRVSGSLERASFYFLRVGCLGLACDDVALGAIDVETRDWEEGVPGWHLGSWEKRRAEKTLLSITMRRTWVWGSQVGCKL